MRITRTAMLAIRGASPGIVDELAEALQKSNATIYRYLDGNDIMLTTAQALEVIRKETGLSDDQILEREEAETQS